jgi:hypothetical protein
MKIALGLLAMWAAAALAGAAWAEPEIMVKCDSTKPTAQRFTRDGGWQPYESPDRSVIITREHNKFAIEVTGDVPLTSHAVFPLPMLHTERFRVLGHDGVETFYLVTGANSGKTELKHSIYGGKDGSHVFNIRVMTLDHCETVSPEIVIGREGQASTAAPKG